MEKKKQPKRIAGGKNAVFKHIEHFETTEDFLNSGIKSQLTKNFKQNHLLTMKEKHMNANIPERDGLKVVQSK